MGKRLYKSTKSKMLSGVCGGIAEYFSIDPTLVRLAWAILTLCTAAFPGILLYIIFAIVIPKDTDINNQPEQSNNSSKSDDDISKMKSANVDN